MEVSALSRFKIVSIHCLLGLAVNHTFAIIRGGSRICEKGGGGGGPGIKIPRCRARKRKKIGQKDKNRPEKKGGGGRGRFGPPPLDPPLIMLDSRLPFPDSVEGIFPGPATTQKVYQDMDWFSQLAATMNDSLEYVD